MTLTIELTPEQEARLAALAGAESVEEYVKGLVRQASESPTSGAEALAYWKREGITGMWSDRADSPELARELRRQAESRE